jgi:hypothetical protein
MTYSSTESVPNQILFRSCGLVKAIAPSVVICGVVQLWSPSVSYRWIVNYELAFLNYRFNQVNQIGTVTERLIEATKMAMQAGWGFMTRHHRSLIRLICSLQVCWNSGLETIKIKNLVNKCNMFDQN